MLLFLLTLRFAVTSVSPLPVAVTLGTLCCYNIVTATVDVTFCRYNRVTATVDFTFCHYNMLPLPLALRFAVTIVLPLPLTLHSVVTSLLPLPLAVTSALPFQLRHRYNRDILSNALLLRRYCQYGGIAVTNLLQEITRCLYKHIFCCLFWRVSC